MISADFLNTFNATISGFIYVDLHQLYPGRACSANGFFALTTAQAADFTILAIALVSLLAVIRLIHLPTLSVWRNRLLICSAAWAIPIITSLAALAMDALRPVDMNWCEIIATRPGLRYALARGWRIAIMLLAMCSYAFIWCFMHRHHSLFSTANGIKAPRGAYTSNNTTGSAFTTCATARSSGALSSARSSSRPNSGAKGAACSEFSLPLQGFDFAGAVPPEREQTIDSRTERISRWIYVRHPGLINSITALNAQSQSRLLVSQTSLDPLLTRPSKVSKDSKFPQMSLAEFPPPDVPLPPKPHYHSQCPKVHKSFEVSIEETPGIAISSPVLVNSQTTRSRYHEYAKSTNSAGARTQSSVETVPWRTRSVGRPAQVKWPFDVSSSPMQSFTRDSTTVASEKRSNLGVQYHSHSPKATQPFDVCVAHNNEPPNLLPPAHSQRKQEPSHLYSSKVARQQHPLTLTSHRHGEPPRHYGPSQRTELLTQRSFERSTDPLQNDSVSMPNYHSQCPKIKHSFEVSVDPPQETRPGPNYHNQCPKVTKTVSISPSGPVMPRTRSLTHQPEIYCTKTTIITAPREPPPSPTPGLPPPPWSPEAREQRRKTFLLSRSTWSDSTLSQHIPSADDAAKSEREIRRTLLLNAYPLAYFILWMPWMVNCFMETQGHTPENMRAMEALLGLPQYLGLINAIIFAANEFLKTMRRNVRIAEMGQTNGEKGSLVFEGV